MKTFVRIIGALFAAGFFLSICVAAAVGYFLWEISRDLPDSKVLANYQPPVMTRIHAADGRLVAEYARERRLYLPIESIPDTVIKAVISAEDKNFYSHAGVDIEGIVRAAIQNLRNRGEKRLVGASTITQQVAKNFLLTNEQTMIRKVKEALLAVKIERQFTKDQILELYLNEIYFGLGSYGIAAASLVYFDKSVHELSLSEAAYFAALPKAPNNYHPFRYPQRAIERRNWVLDRMFTNGYITAEQLEQAKAEPLKVTPRGTGAQIFAADYFAEEVRRVIIERYGNEALYDGGLSVRTTLDPKLQQLARDTLVNGLVEFDQKHGWRGPVKEIAIGSDWGQAVGEIEALNDVAPWRLGVVLSASETEAVVGMQPPHLPSGALSAERETGLVTLEGIKWARWKDGPQKGKKVTAVSQVLKPGDVAYFAPDEDGNLKLEQVPEIEGAMVVMDPHTGRVKALVGGFSYAESEFNRATQAMRQP
ncbi:MAG: transglycosylase domain-containing protein, partial [Rhodobiaceae bacterium]|nr:transglycosylase domain-containing protein [Rhodobiaceae bacterium]